MFNLHFFEDGAEKTFEKFIQQAKKSLALVIDPPFGGKVEILARTLKTMNEKYHQFVGDVTNDISGN